MIIQSLTIENFRSFYGEQTIEFSTDKEKNTTIIYAMNGVGKTNILNAVLWCFHGQFSPSFRNSNDLLNWQAKRRGRKSYHVTIEFFENDVLYRIKRTGGENSNFKVFRVQDGNSEPMSMNPSVFINSIIPKDMANYFISDGEGGNLTVDTQGMISVKRSIRDILGFQVAEKALDDLKIIKKEYREELKKYDVAGELAQTIDKLEWFDTSISRHKKELEDNIEALGNYRVQLERIDEQLAGANIHAIRLQQDQRLKSERQLKEEVGKLVQLKDQKIELVREYSWVAFAHKLSSTALDFIDESELKGKIPAPFNEQLVEDILKEAKCICGADINEGTESHKKIKELLGKAADPGLLNRLQKARSTLTAIRTLAPQAKQRLETNFRNHDAAERKIKELRETLDVLSAQIESVDSESIEKAEKERRMLRSKISETERIIGRKESSIEDLVARRREQKGKAERMKGLSPRALEFKDKIKLVEDVEDVIALELKATLDSIQEVLEKKINHFLDRYLRQDYRAKMTDDFKIGLVDRNERLVPPGGGQGAILSFIYISSLIAIARERRDLDSNILTPGAIAPLIFDAPFSKLDPEYATNVARELPKLVDQLIILMYQDNAKNVDRVLTEEGKLGKEYYLTEEVAGPQNERTIQMMEFNGVKEPVTVYGTPLDRVIVNEVKSYV